MSTTPTTTTTSAVEDLTNKAAEVAPSTLSETKPSEEALKEETKAKEEEVKVAEDTKAKEEEAKTKEPTKEPVSESSAKPVEPELKATTELPAAKEKKEDPAEPQAKGDVDEDELKHQEPKKRTAYHYFVASQQPTIKQENPTLNHLEIVRIISAKWKALSAEEKKPFEEQVLNDKKRAKAAHEADPKAPESEARYSLRNSTMIKDDEVQGKKRGLETEAQEANKKKCVTSEE